MRASIGLLRGLRRGLSRPFVHQRVPALAPYWLFVLGSLFVLVTLLLPRGIVGTVKHYWRVWHERREVVAAERAEAAPKPAE